MPQDFKKNHRIRLTPERGTGKQWFAFEGGNNSVVECNLAKVEVAGSNPVSRSKKVGDIAKW